MELIRGIDNKDHGDELLVCNKNNEKTSKIKRPLQLTVPLEIIRYKTPYKVEVNISNDQ